jgi:RHS repeat-associated protein
VVTGRDHKYGYGGKEEQDELGLEWHDFHARNYDASLGRWMNLDNLSEMYYNHSPFNYTTNNPIYFIDPDGNKIIDNDGIVSKQKSQIASDQNDVNLMVSNGALDTEVAKKINNFYNSVLKEITDLEDSKQVYKVSYDSNFSGNEGETSYDWINHDVAVKFSKSASFGTVGHELKHAYQFETGNVGFTRNGQSPLYDITDETEGYNRELDLERTISQFSPVNPLSPIKGNKRDFTDQDIIDKGKTFTVPAYQNLPSSSISINSKTGRKLRKMAKESGLNDTPVNNVYIGWHKDYNKGVKKRK